MFFNLFSVNINIKIDDEFIREYIGDRYRSFIRENVKLSDCYCIESITLKETSQWRDLIDGNISNPSFCKIIDSSQVYLNIIGSNSYLIYCKNEKKVYLYIDSISQNQKLFIAVQLCNIIYHILWTEGIAILHSSAVTINKDLSCGICFIGDSGAGKTSIALKLAEQGEKMIADDLVYLNSHTMIGVKNTQYIGLHDNNLNNNFNYLNSAIVYSDIFEQNKKRLNLQQCKPNYYANNIKIKDIFLVDSQKSNLPSIKVINKNTVFKYILKNTMFLPGISFDPLINNVDRILSSTNCYLLHTHTDVNSTVECIRNFYN